MTGVLVGAVDAAREAVRPGNGRGEVPEREEGIDSTVVRKRVVPARNADVYSWGV
jgi:hypothetical protein